MDAISINHHQAPPGVAARPPFQFRMALAMAATAFLGFTPTFWAPLAQGVPERIGVIAVHAASSFCWMVFMVYQSWLVVNGKVARHRSAGMIGVSLATVLVIFGAATAINSAQRAAAAGYAGAGETFMIVPLAALVLFAGLFIAAIANVHRPDWHKRLLIAATAVLLDAAIARPYIVLVLMDGNLPAFQGNVGLAGLPGPPPPVTAVLVPALCSLLFIVAGMLRDRHITGRIHQAYVWAFGSALAIHLLKIPVSETAAWHNFAKAFIALAG